MGIAVTHVGDKPQRSGGLLGAREILRWQVEQARRRLSPSSSQSRLQIRGGAVCFPQRFGGSLNLNVRYHVAVPDGIFARQVSSANRPADNLDEPRVASGPPIEFIQLPMPEPYDLETISHAVEVRVVRWLRRRGLLTRNDDEPEPSERSALDACLKGSLGIGELVSLKLADSNTNDEPDQPSRHLQQARRTKSKRGFDIHAAVAVTASDREGRERLLRYCARAPLSLERLAVMPDGRIAYRIKAPRSRQTHRVMTPLQFLARLCALIPPPRHPLIRFHGVFAPHSAWRRAVVSSRVQNPGAETKTTRIESSAHPETPAAEQPAMQDTSKLRHRHRLGHPVETRLRPRRTRLPLRRPPTSHRTHHGAGGRRGNPGLGRPPFPATTTRPGAIARLGTQDALLGTGCDWHPNVEEDARMAGLLATELSASLGW